MTLTRVPALLRRPALLLLPLALVAIAGCGNEVPTNSVAKVEDEVVKKSEFEHWMRAASAGQQPPGATAAAMPDPPNFEKCVAARQKEPVPKGSPKPDAADLKQQCKEQYDALKGQVMAFLVSANWIRLEAEERGIDASPEKIRRQFEQQKKQAFPDEKSYQEFLKSSGRTEQDLLFQVELDYLSNEIRKKVVAGKGNVTDEDIRRYYEKNKKRFAQPERRDLNVVLATSKARAEAAREALEEGQSFSRVARRYSIDQASKSQGGKLPGVAEGQQEKALDEAVFAADVRELVGPVETQFGHYVFEVTKVTPASQQSMGEVKETIRSLIKSEREQKALEAFVKQFRAKYKEKTHCAEGFEVAECENAPERKQPEDKGQPRPKQ